MTLGEAASIAVRCHLATQRRRMDRRGRLIEDQRIPPTTDILAHYEIEIGDTHLREPRVVTVIVFEHAADSATDGAPVRVDVTVVFAQSQIWDAVYCLLRSGMPPKWFSELSPRRHPPASGHLNARTPARRPPCRNIHAADWPSSSGSWAAQARGRKGGRPRHSARTRSNSLNASSGGPLAVRRRGGRSSGGCRAGFTSRPPRSPAGTDVIGTMCLLSVARGAEQRVGVRQ